MWTSYIAPPAIPSRISLDAMRAARRYGEALGRTGADLPDDDVMTSAPGWWQHQVATAYFGSLGLPQILAAE